MPVEVPPMKNLPSKRGSRLRRARSSARRSRPAISFTPSRYDEVPPPTSHFRTSTPQRRIDRKDRKARKDGMDRKARKARKDGIDRKRRKARKDGIDRKGRKGRKD